MKKCLVFIALFSMLSTAAAQAQTQPRSQCLKRCTDQKDPHPERQVRHEETMAKIQARKKAETDPKKIAALEQDEADEIDRYRETHEKTCRKICSYFPDI
ncbi:hypothetical protein [Massilia sp. BJB1822]|uniref:hypothetical protein n=1 Tax=Massilia sp. BJB1822 TaxID=2744470 RepID=UPI001593AADD|nr:hypothetical protein [Massilia sp. BJB1822]NVD99526.1 hypothetical protein [Massilia sp. BJB1822]